MRNTYKKKGKTEPYICITNVFYFWKLFVQNNAEYNNIKNIIKNKHKENIDLSILNPKIHLIKRKKNVAYKSDGCWLRIT